MQYVYDEIILREYEGRGPGSHLLIFPDENKLTETINVMYEKR